MNESVLFETLETPSGKCLGVVTLNVPATLNSLSLEMIERLMPQLLAWRDDDQIALVMFQSSSDKAFSAGGDIQNLYHAMVEHPGGPNPYAETFFEQEYRLDYLLHTFPKPTLVWAHGIVMGGGLGIMGGCRHRIGTATTRLALPEISIGLFPDAGATWFLQQMPRHWAYFIAWTGCQLNAADGCYLGMLDYMLAINHKALLVERLTTVAWSDEAGVNEAEVARLLRQLETEFEDEFPASQVQPHEARVSALMAPVLAAAEPVAAFQKAMNDLVMDTDDKFLQRAAAGFKAGSPTTAHIIHQQLQRADIMNLKQMFEMELVIAVQCSRHPDFTEGVRALLIEKDNQPRWRHADMAAVPEAWVAEHFTPPWPVNPLGDLPEPAA